MPQHLDRRPHLAPDGDQVYKRTQAHVEAIKLPAIHGLPAGLCRPIEFAIGVLDHARLRVGAILASGYGAETVENRVLPGRSHPEEHSDILFSALPRGSIDVAVGSERPIAQGLETIIDGFRIVEVVQDEIAGSSGRDLEHGALVQTATRVCGAVDDAVVALHRTADRLAAIARVAGKAPQHGDFPRLGHLEYHAEVVGSAGSGDAVEIAIEAEDHPVWCGAVGRLENVNSREGAFWGDLEDTAVLSVVAAVVGSVQISVGAQNERSLRAPLIVDFVAKVPQVAKHPDIAQLEHRAEAVCAAGGGGSIKEAIGAEG